MPGWPSPSLSTAITMLWLAGQGPLGSAMVRPTSTLMVSVFSVLPGDQPLIVPVLDALGGMGPSQALFGTSRFSLPPPTRGFSVSAGSVLPQGWVVPESAVPLAGGVAVSLGKFHMCHWPVPALP